jgi:hypothetical protein
MNGETSEEAIRRPHDKIATAAAHAALLSGLTHRSTCCIPSPTTDWKGCCGSAASGWRRPIAPPCLAYYAPPQ